MIYEVTITYSCTETATVEADTPSEAFHLALEADAEPNNDTSVVDYVVKN